MGPWSVSPSDACWSSLIMARLTHTCILTKLHAASKAGKVNNPSEQAALSVEIGIWITTLSPFHRFISQTLESIPAKDDFPRLTHFLTSNTPLLKDALTLWHHTATYSEVYTCQITSAVFCGPATALLFRIKLNNTTKMMDNPIRLQYLFSAEFYLPSAVSFCPKRHILMH